MSLAIVNLTSKFNLEAEVNEAGNTVTAKQVGAISPVARRKSVTLLLANTFLLRAGLERILADTDFDVSRDAATLSQMEVQPDLLILEAAGSSAEMVEAVGVLKLQFPEARIAILADSFDLAGLAAARDAGADGFYLTASNPQVLIKSLEMVMLGEFVLPPALALDLLVRNTQHETSLTAQAPKLTPAAAARVDRLSPRESDVLRCLMNGAPNKVIARQFDVAEATVKVHVKAILRKLGAANRTQAALWATDHLPAAPRAYADA
jgi:two-component system nitrate/nitrite response regulator NarL